MQQQHVIDWWKHRGYRVMVMSDWSLCCVSEAVFLADTMEALRNDAIRQRFAIKWRRQQ